MRASILFPMAAHEYLGSHPFFQPTVAMSMSARVVFSEHVTPA